MTHSSSVNLKGRKIPFNFPKDVSGCWIPGNHQLSAMINGASLTMPYLEPFLIKTIREAGKSINHPSLKKDVAGFASQESYHFRTHRQFNDLLIENHYPELKAVEDSMESSYQNLSNRSLQTRMAYTAGFEAMTIGVTKWIIGERSNLFQGADPHVTSFILWHMVEETEHKRVAHDVYEALFGNGLVSYFKRAIGVFHGSFDVIRFSRRGYIAILKKDNLWWSISARLKLYQRICEFGWHVIPFLLRAALPAHDPRQEKDLAWVVDWLDGYESHPEEIPIVDTNNPAMPVPFSNANSQLVGAKA